VHGASRRGDAQGTQRALGARRLLEAPGYSARLLEAPGGSEAPKAPKRAEVSQAAEGRPPCPPARTHAHARTPSRTHACVTHARNAHMQAGREATARCARDLRRARGKARQASRGAGTRAHKHACTPARPIRSDPIRSDPIRSDPIAQATRGARLREVPGESEAPKRAEVSEGER